jgi:hypothetical protein
MNLDIDTERGRETVLQERRAKRLFEARFPSRKYLMPKKTGSPAPLDGIIISDDTLTALVETKCRRNLTRDGLRRWGDRWLVTYDKVANGLLIAKAVEVAFVGILYLVDADHVLVVTIWSPAGHRSPFYVEETETQKTVNGGKAVRPNAYINVTGAVEFTGADLGVSGTWRDEAP